LYERLFAVERPGAGDADFRNELNPDSLSVVTAMVEPALAQAAPGARFQFERKGYFCVDTEDSADGAPVFNRTVTLKDAWGRIQKRETPAPAKPTPPKSTSKPKKQKKAPLDVETARAGKSPALAAAFDRYRTVLGLGDEDAHLLTENTGRAAFFDAAVTAHNNPQKIANVINNTLMATLKERPVDALPFGGAALGVLVQLLDEEAISSRIARTVLERMLAGEGDPQTIVDRHGLRQLSTPETLLPLIDQVFAANPDSVAALRAGDRKHHGFLVGQIMKASQGRANPKVLNQLLQARLRD
jgi:glutaminyl-tRNA synthetase